MVQKMGWKPGEGSGCMGKEHGWSCHRKYFTHEGCSVQWIQGKRAYLTKSASNPGAGDILMGFLGSVILSFAFSMFCQRKLVK
jgi:hypothetical protein